MTPAPLPGAPALFSDLPPAPDDYLYAEMVAAKPAPDAMKTALDACDNYRELLAARGHYAHLVLNPLWDAYRAARAKVQP